MSDAIDKAQDIVLGRVPRERDATDVLERHHYGQAKAVFNDYIGRHDVAEKDDREDESEWSPQAKRAHEALQEINAELEEEDN